MVAEFAGECLGKTQHKMLQELERVRDARWRWEAAQLPRGDRQRLAFLHCQPHSSGAWVNAMPTAENELSNPQLAEVAARFLGLPSPACARVLGQQVAGKRTVGGAPVVVDPFGECFASVPLEDGFRKRHNDFERVLHRVMRECGVRASTEVYGLFSAITPQVGLAQVDTDRQRQGLVPDFLIEPGQGLAIEGLAEFKFIGSCPSHYPGPENGSLVDRQAKTFQARYEANLARPGVWMTLRVLSFGAFGPLVG